jgi:hypothetical protein
MLIDFFRRRPVTLKTGAKHRPGWQLYNEF